MSGSFEEQYMGILQNIEFALVTVYRQNPKMNDHAALFVVESLIKLYNAEAQGRTSATPQFQPYEQEAFDGVKALLDWRLGKQSLVAKDGQEISVGADTHTHAEIVACLKRIAKSIEGWTKRGGRRGYFEFVSQYVQ
jgi:hypothetical protein